MSNVEDSRHGHLLRAPVSRPAPAGLFVTFEGGDGGGKSTQIDLLATWLRGPASPLDSPDVTVTKEPGGTALGTKIRELILHSDHVDERAEALLYAADRAHHVATTVRPALEAGGVVLSDRFFDSSRAYQGAGRQLDADEVHALSLWAARGLEPHLTFLLDVDPEVLATRRDAAMHDRLERAGIAFHERVRAAFLELARSEPERFVVIDASQSIDAVHADITIALTDWLRAHNHMVQPPAQHPLEGTPSPQRHP